MRQSLTVRVAVVILLPFVAYLSAAGLMLRHNFDVERQAAAAIDNIAVVSAVSELVRELQRERGKSGLFLSGAAPQADLEEQRLKTDAAAEPVRAALAHAALPREVLAIGEKAVAALTALREAVAAKAIEPPAATRGYVGLIAQWLTLQAAMADATELGDLSGRIRGIAILEEARESAGQLRVVVANVLAANRSFDRELLQRIIQLNNSVGPTLALRGVQISSDARARIRGFAAAPHWQKSAATVDSVVHAAEVGNFGIDPKVWFDGVSAMIDDIGEVIAGEVGRLAATAAETEASMLVQSRVSLGVVVAIGLLLGFLTWRFQTRTVRPLREIAERLGRISHETSSGSEQLASSSQKVAASAAEQAAAIQETVASMTEMTSMLAQTTSHAVRANDVAGDASRRSQDGTVTMDRLVTAMEELATANGRLKDITGIIAEICKKTDVINDIAFKTQLLSFNASIEAARAGQHGKGFAVVANEVGNLATMSSKAASEVEALLGDSRDHVARIVSDTDACVRSGRGVCDAADATFKEIARAVAAISASVSQIKDAAREQEAGVQQTSAAMAQMNEATAGSNRMAGDNAGLSRQLRLQAESLARLEQLMKTIVVGAQKPKKAKPRGLEALLDAPAEPASVERPVPAPEPVVAAADEGDAEAMVESLVKRLSDRAAGGEPLPDVTRKSA